MPAAVLAAVPAAVPEAVPAAVPAAVLVEVPLINALKSKPVILQVNVNLSEKIYRRISTRQRYLHFITEHPIFLGIIYPKGNYARARA